MLLGPLHLPRTIRTDRTEAYRVTKRDMWCSFTCHINSRLDAHIAVGPCMNMHEDRVVLFSDEYLTRCK